MVNEYLKELTCLYVEDDDFTRESFTKLLKRYFKEVITASNGKEGLEKFKNYTPDIIITDIKMPILNGIEMIKEIRKIKEDIVVFFITAFTDTEYLKEAIELQVDGYLTKPIKKEILLKKLNKIATFLKAKKESQEYLEILKVIMDNVPTAIAVLKDNTTVLVNKKFKEIFQKNKIEDLDIDLTKNRIIVNNSILEVDVKYINRFKLITFVNISGLKEIFTDELTTLYNRKIIDLKLKEILFHNIGIIILDIDNFKLINDKYGHLKGDEVLQKLSFLLKNSLRKDDIIIRWGGEEFLILVKDINTQNLSKIALSLKEKIEKSIIDKNIYITCSFGVCYGYVQSKDDIYKLIEMADNALYEAKKSGKNRVIICKGENNE